MWKKVLAGSAALVIVGSSLLYAQEHFRDRDRARGMDRWRPNAEDMGAFVDARIAGMKAGLRLTPDQEKNWPAFEGAYRGLAKLRTERVAALRDRIASMRADRRAGGDARPGENRRPFGNIVERMQRRADALTRAAAAFKAFSDAAAPLYQSLDDGQKRRFDVLARTLRPNQRMADARERGRFRADGERSRRGGPDGRQFDRQSPPTRGGDETPDSQR